MVGAFYFREILIEVALILRIKICDKMSQEYIDKTSRKIYNINIVIKE